MQTLKILSPAKINLSLYVLGRRPDGFHQLSTLFHRISLIDRLSLRKRPYGITLTCSNKKLSTGEDNLIKRAYRALENEVPALGGVAVSLQKKIPVQGGLGGGSSNAASFLLGMNRLYRLALSLKTLEKIGRRLGADVPFFLHQVNQAVGTGRGDRIRPCRSKRRFWFVVVLFERGLSTRACFEAYDRAPKGASLTNRGPVAKIPRLIPDRGDALEATSRLHNDLEQTALALNPEIRKVLAYCVQLGAPAAAMSGSGPTVFVMTGTQQEAGSVAGRLGAFVAPERIKVCRTF